MVVGPFDQLCGAAGDVRELEYVSALHQTDRDELRRDASIRQEDIRLFLSSRFGIVVDDATIQRMILGDLAGTGKGENNPSLTGEGCDEEGEQVLDLMELVAVLFIPTFIKASLQLNGKALPQDVTRAPSGMLDYVLKMILHDTTGTSSPKPLSVELLKRIFISYGEVGLANDSVLLREMVEHAASVADNDDETDMDNRSLMLDTRTFARALANDLNLYDIRNEVRLTTSYEDVFLNKDALEMAARRSAFPGGKSIGRGRPVPQDAGTSNQHQEAPNTGATSAAADEENNITPQMKNSFASQDLRERLSVVKTVPIRRFMAASIDITAGLYRSQGLVVSLWATMLITYFAYVFMASSLFGGNGGGGEGEEEQFCYQEYAYSLNAAWSDNRSAIGCDMFEQIAGWVLVFFLISFVGVAFVSLGSIGNYVGTQVWKPLIGASVCLFFVFVPYYTYDREKHADDECTYGVRVPDIQ